MSDVWVMEETSPTSAFDYVNDGASPSASNAPPVDQQLPGQLKEQPALAVGPNSISATNQPPYVAVQDSAAITALSINGHSTTSRNASVFQRLARSWLVLRWRLATNIFAVPLPFLTVNFDVKLGDLVLTLPLIAALVAVNAAGAQQKDVGGTGTLPGLTMAALFAFAVRNNSVLLVVTGLSFERALFYHKLFGIVTIVLSGLHGLAYLLADHSVDTTNLPTDRSGNRIDSGGKQYDSGQVLTGCVAFFSMVALYVLSLNFIRRRYFELFIRLHWVLFIVILAFAVIHGAAVALIGVVPWLIDLVFRLAYRTRVYSQGGLGKANSSVQRKGVIARDQISICKLPGNITRIQFPRVRSDTGEEFKYTAGQYAFLCVPSISMLQWHPFTISSAPHEEMVTFHIRSMGDWTSKLAAKAPPTEDSGVGGSLPCPFDILVDGPYGSLSIDLDANFTTYSHIVLLCGGIGITPMMSVVNQLYRNFYYQKRLAIKSVRFVWAAKDRETVQAFVTQSGSAASLIPHNLVDQEAMTNDTTFKTEIFLTQGTHQWQNVEPQIDQQLGNCLRYNARPDIATILREMGQQALQNHNERVAVLVCGPGPMVKETMLQSVKLSREMKVQFDVHHEYFEF